MIFITKHVLIKFDRIDSFRNSVNRSYDSPVNRKEAQVQLQNFSKQSFKSDVCCVLCERMDEFISVRPNGKPVSCTNH